MKKKDRCNATLDHAAVGRCWLRKGHHGNHSFWIYSWKRRKEKPNGLKLLKQRRKIIKKILANLTDDLRRKPWKGSKNQVAGHCYVASEALYHLCRGGEAGLTPMRIKHGKSTHWYLRTNKGKYVDITKSQFSKPVQYCKGVGSGFLTALPSKRAKILINRVLGVKDNE